MVCVSVFGFSSRGTRVVASSCSGNYGNSMDGQNQSVGRSMSSSDEEEEEEGEEPAAAQEEDTASVQQVEPEWRSTTDLVKPTTTDRSANERPG